MHKLLAIPDGNELLQQVYDEMDAAQHQLREGHDLDLAHVFSTFAEGWDLVQRHVAGTEARVDGDTDADDEDSDGDSAKARGRDARPGARSIPDAYRRTTSDESGDIARSADSWISSGYGSLGGSKFGGSTDTLTDSARPRSLSLRSTGSITHERFYVNKSIEMHQTVEKTPVRRIVLDTVIGSRKGEGATCRVIANPVVDEGIWSQFIKSAAMLTQSANDPESRLSSEHRQLLENWAMEMISTIPIHGIHPDVEELETFTMHYLTTNGIIPKLPPESHPKYQHIKAERDRLETKFKESAFHVFIALALRTPTFVSDPDAMRQTIEFLILFFVCDDTAEKLTPKVGETFLGKIKDILENPTKEPSALLEEFKANHPEAPPKVSLILEKLLVEIQLQTLRTCRSLGILDPSTADDALKSLKFTEQQQADYTTKCKLWVDSLKKQFDSVLNFELEGLQEKNTNSKIPSWVEFLEHRKVLVGLLPMLEHGDMMLGIQHIDGIADMLGCETLLNSLGSFARSVIVYSNDGLSAKEFYQSARRLAEKVTPETKAPKELVNYVAMQLDVSENLKDQLSEIILVPDVDSDGNILSSEPKYQLVVKKDDDPLDPKTDIILISLHDELPEGFQYVTKASLVPINAVTVLAHNDDSSLEAAHMKLNVLLRDAIDAMYKDFEKLISSLTKAMLNPDHTAMLKELNIGKLTEALLLPLMYAKATVMWQLMSGRYRTPGDGKADYELLRLMEQMERESLRLVHSLICEGEPEKSRIRLYESKLKDDEPLEQLQEALSILRGTPLSSSSAPVESASARKGHSKFQEIASRSASFLAPLPDDKEKIATLTSHAERVRELARKELEILEREKAYIMRARSDSTSSRSDSTSSADGGAAKAAKAARQRRHTHQQAGAQRRSPSPLAKGGTVMTRDFALLEHELERGAHHDGRGSVTPTPHVTSPAPVSVPPEEAPLAEEPNK